MQLTYLVNAFHLQKRGNDPREYEDAFWFPRMESGGRTTRDLLRVAIADGATESSFAKEWANLLVDAYKRQRFSTVDALKKVLRRLAGKWEKGIDLGKLPWFAEEKARMGAYAAFLGLKVSAQAADWEAIAIGDCCLFHIHDGRLSTAFPIDESRSFGNSPALLSSNLCRNASIWDRILLRQGSCSPGDVFILLTDALAAWFLQQCEVGEHPWEILKAMTEPTNAADNEFAGWIESQRASAQMKNDDVTCLLVKVQGIEDGTSQRG